MSARIDHHTSRTVELGIDRRDAVPVIPEGANAGVRGDHTACGNFANSMIGRIRNVEGSPGIHPDILWLIELGIYRQAAISGKSRDPVARNCSDGSSSVNPANPMIKRIGNVDVPLNIESYPSGIVEESRRG